MNIQQLKDQLAATPNVLKAYFPPDAGMTDHQDYLFIKLYEKTSESTADDRSYCVVVKDRGKATEEIYFKGQVPVSMQTPSTAFRSKVVAGIEAYQTTHPELVYYEIASLSESDKVARVTAYELAGGNVSPKNYLLFQNAAGTLQRYTIV